MKRKLTITAGIVAVTATMLSACSEPARYEAPRPVSYSCEQLYYDQGVLSERGFRQCVDEREYDRYMRRFDHDF